MTDIQNWLLDQIPVVVVLGIVIYVLYKMYREKDREVSEMAKEVIKLTALWEAKAEKLDDGGFKTEVLRSLDELKGNKCLAQEREIKR